MLDIYEPWKSYNSDLRAVFLHNCRNLNTVQEILDETELFRNAAMKRQTLGVRQIIEMISDENGRNSRPSPALAYINTIFAKPKKTRCEYLVAYNE